MSICRTRRTSDVITLEHSEYEVSTNVSSRSGRRHSAVKQLQDETKRHVSSRQSSTLTVTSSGALTVTSSGHTDYDIIRHTDLKTFTKGLTFWYVVLKLSAHIKGDQLGSGILLLDITLYQFPPGTQTAIPVYSCTHVHVQVCMYVCMYLHVVVFYCRCVCV